MSDNRISPHDCLIGILRYASRTIRRSIGRKRREEKERKGKERRVVKSYSAGLGLSITSHQSKQLNVVNSLRSSAIPFAPKTQRSGEAMKNLAYLMTLSFDAPVGGVNKSENENDRGSVVIGGLLDGKTHVIPIARNDTKTTRSRSITPECESGLFLKGGPWPPGSLPRLCTPYINSPQAQNPTLSLSIAKSSTKKRRCCITATYVQRRKRNSNNCCIAGESTDGSFFTAKAMAKVHVAMLGAQPRLHTNVPFILKQASEYSIR